MFIPRTLSSAIDKVARQTIGKDWNLYAALLEHWKEIVGIDYARHTTPVKITFPHQPMEPKRCNGTLCVRLPKGLSMEFTYKSEQIRQRINTYFGYEAIARITFDPVYGVPEAPKQAKEADPEKLQDMKDASQIIDNEELRSALETFGEAVLKSRG